MAETTTDAAAEPTAEEISEQKAVRLAKRERLIAASDDLGQGAYPVRLPITATIPAVRDASCGLGVDEATGEQVGLAGRVVFSRNTGKLCFATLQSGDGSRIQAMVSLAEVGEESLAGWKELVDLGDHVFVSGEVISSRRGELSIMVTEWQIASKAILPLPNLHNELCEETRVRSRYLDLIAREQARTQRHRPRQGQREPALARSTRHGFLEVETPMLQVMHGGASARPFVTHSNAFDTELFLRIAPELYLKRAVVGGIERVFEINRNFRNEGADSTHSPEFAMLEAYEAYGDYTTMADLTQKLIQNAALAVAGSHVVTWADGTEYDLGGEWDRAVDVRLALGGGGRADHRRHPDVATRRSSPTPRASRSTTRCHGKYVEELWEHFVKAELERPTFVMDFPVDTSPARAASTARSRASSRSGTSTSAASSSPPATPSSSTRSCSASASSSRRSSPLPATPRRCASTRSSCARSSSACPRRAAWAWASTGC